MTTFWNDENTAQASRLWLAGTSATEIAKIIGAVSRNVIVSKMYRLGLQLPPAEAASRRGWLNVVKASKARPPKRPKGRPKKTPPRLEAVVANDLPTPPPAATILLHTRGCRWPVTGGRPRHMDEVLFCNGRIAKGRFCAQHAKLAYLPPKKK